MSNVVLPSARRDKGVKTNLAPGKRVPGTSYKVVRWLGEGAMGIVFEAEHVELGKRVALKVLDADLSRDPTALKSFREEARASAKIGSPYIVDVFDFASLPDGRFAIAMELLSGQNLQEASERGHIEQARLLGILRQVCKGLGDAHGAGIVHRDVKPENVMLTQRDRRGDFVKLVDFGVSSVLGDRDAGSEAGTPLYMAPEIIAAKPIDGRADIYSLGCMAYELVSGSPPFEGDVYSVLKQHMDTAPEPLGGKPGVQIADEFEDVILRCLAKDPDARYRDVADLEAALVEAQLEAGLVTDWDDLPLPDGLDPDRRAALLERLPDDSRSSDTRAPILMWAAGGGAAVLLLIVVVWLLVGRAGDDTGDERIVDDLTARAQAAGSEAMWVYPPVAEPGRETAFQIVRRLESLEGEGSSAGMERATELRETFSDALVRLGDDYWGVPGGKPFAMDFYIQALLFDDAREPARSRAGLSLGQLQALRLQAGKGEYSKGELVAVEPLLVLAEPDLERRAEKLEELRGEGAGSMSASLDARLDELAGGGGLRRSTRPRVEAPSRADSNPDLVDGGPVASENPVEIAADGAAPQKQDPVKERGSNPERAREYVARGRTAQGAGKLKVAERHYHEALRSDPDSVDAMIGLGDLLFDQGQYSTAVRFRKMAVRRRSRDPKLQMGLGDAYYKIVRYEDALAAYERAHKLGYPKAAQRIEKVESKIGK